MYKVFYHVLLLEILLFTINPKANARYIPEKRFKRFDDSVHPDMSIPDSSNVREYLLEKLRQIPEEDELLSDVRNVNWIREVSAEERSIRDNVDQFRSKRNAYGEQQEEQVPSLNSKKLNKNSKDLRVTKMVEYSNSSDSSDINTNDKLKVVRNDKKLVNIRKTDDGENQKLNIHNDELYDWIIDSLKNIVEKTEVIKASDDHFDNLQEQNVTKNKRNIFDTKGTLLEKEEQPKIKSFLDYTNSQAPFNEGSIKFRGSNPEDYAFLNQDFYPSHEKIKRHGSNVRKKRDEETLAVICPLEGEGDEELKQRIYRAIQNRLYQLMNSTLDHTNGDINRKRRDYMNEDSVKMQRKKADTLIEKELVMERVLDPNLNFDGFLEPHVRGRRVDIESEK